MCHIVGDNLNFRDKILSTNIIDEVMKSLKTDNVRVDLLPNSIWFFALLVKLNDTTPPRKIIMECLNIFNGFLNTQESEVINHCLWGLYYLSNLKTSNVNKEILKLKIPERVLKLNFDRNHHCIGIALRLLGNLLADNYPIVDVS